MTLKKVQNAKSADNGKNGGPSKSGTASGIGRSMSLLFRFRCCKPKKPATTTSS